MNVSLTPELDRFVHAKVATGRYNSASEVLREALRLLQDRDELREFQISNAKQRISAGLVALETGDFVEGTASDLYEDAIGRSRLRLTAAKK